MLGLEALSTMKVMVATPMYGFTCTPHYALSMLRLHAEAASVGLEFVVETLSDANICRARGRLLAKFLANPVLTHLFWIDADVGFKPEAFARILLADRDVACGVYPLKRYDWPEEIPAGMTKEIFEAAFTPYPFNPLPGGNLRMEEDGFGEVAEAPNGFMCIKREVFFQMMSQMSFLRYVPDEYQDGGPMHGQEDPGHHWLFYENLVDQKTKRLLTEDYAFCHRWRQCGGKVHIDLHSKLTHSGPYQWSGDLHAHLQVSQIRKKEVA